MPNLYLIEMDDGEYADYVLASSMCEAVEAWKAHYATECGDIEDPDSVSLVQQNFEPITV